MKRKTVCSESVTVKASGNRVTNNNANELIKTEVNTVYGLDTHLEIKQNKTKTNGSICKL